MPRNHHSRIFGPFLACLVVLASHAAAEDGITLRIEDSSVANNSIEFSLSALDAMEQTEFTTTTNWTNGPTNFSGVALATVLEAAEVDGETLEMIALNDYAVQMPMDAIEEDVPIIATRVNGETMSVRDKGPFWVVYPYDSAPEYKTETVFSRSVWQLSRLKILD